MALQSTAQPAACGLLQPAAVLSAQIITPDGPPNKQAVQMIRSLDVSLEKKLLQQQDLQITDLQDRDPF